MVIQKLMLVSGADIGVDASGACTGAMDVHGVGVGACGACAGAMDVHGVGVGACGAGPDGDCGSGGSGS